MERALIQETILPLISKQDTQDVIHWMKINNLLRELMLQCGCLEIRRYNDSNIIISFYIEAYFLYTIIFSVMNKNDQY